MSTAVFLGHPMQGHINPTIGVVKELVSRGEKVIYFATPEFKAKIKGMGAEFRSYRISGKRKSDFENILVQKKISIELLNDLGKRAIGMMDLYFDIMQNQKQDLKKIIAEMKPDYLIHDACAYWGKILAKELRIPAIASVTTFAYSDRLFETNPDFVIGKILRMADHYRKDPRVTRKVLQRISNMIGSLIHIDDYDYIDFVCSREPLNIVYTSKEFQWLGEHFDSGFKFVGPSLYPRNDSGRFPWERLDGRNLIYISFGTVLGNAPACIDFYRKCFEAFRDWDHQVVVAVGDPDRKKLGKIPGNFLIGKMVPQVEVLKRAALFVTHCGMNSVNEALYYHVPLLGIPQRWDQFQAADRVLELGAGIVLKNMEFTAGELGEAARRILADESYRRRCEIIGETLKAAGGYQRAADEIFQFKRDHCIK